MKSTSESTPAGSDPPPQSMRGNQDLPKCSVCQQQQYELTEDGESSIVVEHPPITFGRGALDEAGMHAAALGCRRVALFTDPRVGKLEYVARVLPSLRRAGVDFTIYDAVHLEPTDQSFQAAARFAREGHFDGFVSVGGGSTINTCVV